MAAGYVLFATLILALTVYGFDYYTLGSADRPFSSKFTALRPSGTVGLELGWLGVTMYLTAEAIARTQEDGIIFLDELDKIAGTEKQHGPDVSRQGVQRDLLPIVEGSTVMTKYGPVKTDHVLFVAAGAFHVAKPSDLIPELQGRFPIRVELKSLSVEDFIRILKEPKNALTKQYTKLFGLEEVKITFDEGALAEALATELPLHLMGEPGIGVEVDLDFIRAHRVG